MAKIDYNKLMSDLDSCLGLEGVSAKPSSATESIKTKSTKKAFEGYDDIESELAQSLEGFDCQAKKKATEAEDDFVFEDENSSVELEEESEESPEEVFRKSAEVLIAELNEQGMEQEDIKENLISVVNSLFSEEEEENPEETLPAEEGVGELGPSNLISLSDFKMKVEEADGAFDPDSGSEHAVVEFTDSNKAKVFAENLISLLGTTPDYIFVTDNEGREGSSVWVDESLFDFEETEGSAEESLNSGAKKGQTGVVTHTTVRERGGRYIQVKLSDGSVVNGLSELNLKVGDKAQSLPAEADDDKWIKASEEEGSAEEALAKKKSGSIVAKLKALAGATEEQEPAEDDENSTNLDAAYESLCSKMLSRYSSLARKPIKSKANATEGKADRSPIKLDDDAVSRVSCEFGYSGKNLRKIVTEALEKGVI